MLARVWQRLLVGTGQYRDIVRVFARTEWRGQGDKLIRDKGKSDRKEGEAKQQTTRSAGQLDLDRS